MLHVLRKKSIILLGVTVVLAFLNACSSKDQVPRDFPDEKEMAEILADLYLTENVISHERGSGKINEDIPGYYKNILEKYDLTMARFDTIRKWYAEHPARYQEVYDQTIVLLNRREASLKQTIAEEESRLDSIQKIEDIWIDERKKVVHADDTTDRRLPFDFAIHSVSGGKIRLTALYKFFREDLTREGRMTMVTLYADSTADTLSVQLEKTFQQKAATLEQPLDSLKTGTGVSGFLFDHDTTVVTDIEFSKIQLQYFPDDEEGTVSEPDTINPDHR
jgi:hypothetical protein